MSLNDFAPYIQFLAAFYLSLAFESLINRFFIQPFEKQVEELYQIVANQYNFGEQRQERLRQKLNERKQKILSFTKRMSICSLVMCLILLLVAAIEISVPPTIFSWEKNSWFGYWWIMVIFAISCPAIYCLGYAYRYCTYVLPNIKKRIASINEEISRNLNHYMSKHPNMYDEWFKEEIITHLTNNNITNVTELFDKVRESYSGRAFDDIIKKI